MRNLFISLLLGVVTITMSFETLADCSNIRNFRDKYRDKCNKKGGPNSYEGRDSKACNKAKSWEGQLQLCEKYQKERDAYYREIEVLNAATTALIEKKQRRETKKVECETKVTSLVNKYYNNLTNADNELARRLEQLAENYIERGLDLDDPQILQQYLNAAGAIERECTANHLRGMLLL